MTDRELMSNVLCDVNLVNVRFYQDESGFVDTCEVEYEDGSIGTLIYSSGEWHYPKHNYESVLDGRYF